MVLIYPIIGDVNFNHLLKEMSVRFLQRVTLISIVINMNLRERYFVWDSVIILSSNFHPQMLALVKDSCLKQLLLWCCQTDFLFSRFLHLTFFS